MTGWNIDPGLWEIAQGTDANNDDLADGNPAVRTAPLGRSQSIELTLAPATATVITFKLKTPGTPYWQRPDLGLDREDVVVRGREVRVTVHNVGAVEAPAAKVVLTSATGQVLVSAPTPALAAPADLRPKTAEIVLKLPAGADLTGGSVEIEPAAGLDEITAMNNTVKL